MEGMKAQYQILSALRKIDEKRVRLQAEADHIPTEIQKLEDALGLRRGDYDSAKQVAEGQDKEQRKAESDLREKEDKLKKAEEKMMEVKTNEEYQAAMKENQVIKDEKSALEDKVLSFINKAEEQRQRLKEAEKVFKEYENVAKKEIQQLEEERKRISSLITEQENKKSATSSQLDPEVSLLYSRVSARVKGVAVVNVENGMCLGCHIKIRPQLYNEVLGYKTLHRCPNCSRILIISNETEAASNEESAAK